MKGNKGGVSLVVLVITIIVMIILASAVMISLSSTNIFNKANEAVSKTNMQQIQSLASLAWSEAYLDKRKGQDVDFNERIEEAFRKNGIKPENYLIKVSDSGVKVYEAKLGALIKGADDYGKTVDYSVTIGTTEYKDWKVLYEDVKNGYVFLIYSTRFSNPILNAGTTVASLTNEEKELYKKFQVGDFPKYTLTDGPEGTTYVNNQAVAQLIKEYGGFANSEDYGNYVIGAIGSPTIELLVAGINAKGQTPALTLTTHTYGYKINGVTWAEVPSDGVYLPTWYHMWVASPMGSASDKIIRAGTGNSQGMIAETGNTANFLWTRPVICLSADIPADFGTTTDYTLTVNK